MPGSRTQAITQRGAAALLVALLALGSGCRGPKAANPPGKPVSEPVISISPVVGSEAGLEVVSWSAPADDAAFAAALLPLQEHLSPVSSETEILWRAHGLRLLSLPIADVNAFIAALSTGASQRQWLGQAVVWTETVRGPLLNEGQVVAIDAERIRLGAGSLRLLARSWVEPVPAKTAGEAPRAALRLDLVPQHMDDPDKAVRDDPLNVRPPSTGAEDQGLLFTRLAARLSLTGEQAVVVVSERPGTDWSQPPVEEGAPQGAAAPRPAPKVGEVVRPGSASGSKAAAPKRRAGDQSSDGWPTAARPEEPPAPAPARAESVGVALPAGPKAPRVPTLGEAMLGRPGARRMIVIYLPRVPERFELLGEPGAPVSPPDS